VPTPSPLVSGEPAPIVQVSSNEPVPLTEIDTLPIAVTEKSPAIAVAEVEELDELDELEALEELEDWLPGDEGSGGCRRSISNRTPPSQTILTVDPTNSRWIEGFAESDVIRHVLPCTVIECALNRVIEPFVVHLGVPAMAAGAARPTSTTAARAMRPTLG